MPNIVTNIRWTDNTRDMARNVSSGLDVVGRSVGEVRQQVREASKTVQELEKALNTIKPSGKALVDLSAELDRAKSAHAALKQELAALDPKAKGAAAALKQVGTDASGAGKGLKEAGDGAKDAGEKADKAKQSFQQIGASLSTVGRGLTAAVTVPIVGAAAASIKFASDFEADMVKVHTLSGVTEADMQDMKAAILALGPAVGIGPDELAKAMLAVTSTGIKGKEALDVLTISAKASAVGMGEAATIARTITSIIKAYGEENITAGKAAEVMFKIVKDGNADAAELAGSLGRVVGIASTLGVAFEDVGTFIATFTRIGVNTAEAVTALRGFIGALQLKKPSDDAKAALASVDLTFDQLRKSIKDVGLTATALDLFGRFKGHEEDLQPVIANIRAMAGAMGTYGAQAKDVVEIQKHMVAQTTELTDAFGRTKQTSAQQWKELTAQLQVLAITIGNELLPHVNNLLQNNLIPGIKTVEGWVNAWRQLPEPVKEFSLVLAGLGAAGGPILLGLGALARSIGAIQTLLFGSNVVSATSVAGILAKLGITAPGAGAAAAGTGLTGAEGAGLAALQNKLGWGGTVAQGLPKMGAIATGGFLLGNSAMSLSGADAAKAEADIRAWLSKAFIESLPKPSTAKADALFPGGKPPEIGATGIIPGTRIEDVLEEAKGLSTVAEKVKALTDAQREDIKVRRERGESIKVISKEMQLESDVVSSFIRQQKDGTKGSKEYADAWRELSSVGITYRDTLSSLSAEQVSTLEYYLKAGNSVATLAKAFPNLTRAQIEAVDAQLKLKLATVPLTDEQSQLAVQLLRVNEASGETVHSIEAIAKAAGAAPVQIRVLKGILEELEKVEKGFKLTGPIAGLELTNPKKEITEYRVELGKLTKAQQEAEDAQLSGIAAAVRAIERRRDAEIAAVTAELGADNELAKKRIALARDTADKQIALAQGTSRDIVAITHALGLATQQELQANVAKYKAEYETLKRDVTATWEAIDAARKRYEQALAASNAGEAFKQGLKHSLQGIPDLMIQSFLGGGGLEGALSALGVQMGKVFAEALMRSVQESTRGVALPPGVEGPVPKGRGWSATTMYAAAGTGALAGIGAEASGASGRQAAATVGLTAASVGAQVAVTAGSWTAGLAAGAATAGIGLAVVAAIEIYKAKHMAQWEKLGKDIGRDFGVSLSKETLKEWEKESKQIGRQATELFHLDEIIAAKGGIKAFGFDKAAQGAHDLFSMIDQGKLSVTAVKSELDKLWPELAKGGTDAYGRISEKLKELIRLNDKFGTQSAAIAEFQRGQAQNLVGGVNATVDILGTTDVHDKKTTFESIGKEVTDAKAAVDALTKDGKRGTREWEEAVKKLKDAYAHQAAAAVRNKETLDDLGLQALGAFAAARATGASEAEALAAIGPSLKTLRESYKALGLDVEDVGLKALLMQDSILNGTDKLGAGVAGLNQQFVALDNLGLLDQKTFESLERTGVKMFERLQAKAIENGGTQKDALIPMQQWLHEAKDAAEKYGYKLDDATQHMIDLSKETGIWKDEDPTKDKEKGMRDLIDAVHDLVDALRGIPPKVKTEVDVGVHWDVPSLPRSPNIYGDEPERVATGGVVRPWGVQHFAPDTDMPTFPLGRDTVPAMLSVDEVIFNPSQQARLTSMLQAGALAANALLTVGAGGQADSRMTTPREPVQVVLEVDGRELGYVMWDPQTLSGNVRQRARLQVQQMGDET